MDPLFQVHKLNPDGMKKAEALAESFNDLLEKVTSVVGSSPSREFSLVRTHLETASFYAKKAIAINPANQL